MTHPQYHTLREVAEALRSSHSSVLALVTSGQLEAVDVSTRPTGRRRYIVPVAALEAFRQRRAVRPATAKVGRRRRKRRQDVGIIEFIR